MKNEQINELVHGMVSVLPTFNRKLLEIGQHIIQKDGISLQQLHLLFVIRKMNKATTTELAQKLSVTKSNITGLSDKLVTQSFIERQAHETDRRVMHLLLTPKGHDYLLAFQQNAKVMIGERFEHFTEEDILLFAETMNNMSVLLKKMK